MDIYGERRGGCINESDSTINKGGRQRGGGVGGGHGGVDTGAATSAGGMVRPASASVKARLDQGGGNKPAAMTKGAGGVASMGAGGEK